tara:strand:- start:4732 stop:5322 length:591 start_codon:yes stop_codon:yes gene_type:complete
MFKKTGYQIVRKALSKELTSFCYSALKVRKEALERMMKDGCKEAEDAVHGTIGDGQIPGSFSIYSDSTMETLSLILKPIIEKTTKKKLVPTYTYARVYKKGDILWPHKDRHACEYSITLALGGDEWPIYMDGIELNLNPGDLAVYKGCEIEHWRNEFNGKECVQCFLHYNEINEKALPYDTRSYIATPLSTRKGSK